ncbi:MAG: tetratricopeptide repeat protein [Anaerolineales bacterium]|nr:tetratricopeptide repeat protein [Anaerolineales bacterium]
MADDKMLQEAIEAVANGNRDRARDLLTRLLKANQTNPKYWLWMSSVVESTKERIYCLQKVLHLEPDNKAAQLGLLLQGAANSGSGMQSQPVLHRDWRKSYKTASLDSSPGKIARIVMYAGASIVVVGLVLIGFIAPRITNAGYFGGVQLTVTPIFETVAATATLLPTNTPRAVTPTPTFIGPTPLWMFLEATYTPTPLYVNTPHPATEAYRAGIRAFTNRNYQEMIFFMEQATQTEPDQADIQYYLGEAYLQSEQPENALYAYEKAIEINQNFAPAYLGRARALSAIDPEFDLEGDLSQAIALDPDFSAPKLDLIAFYLSVGEYDQASVLLDSAEVINPDSPLIFAYRSQVLLNSGDYDGAFEAAEKAYGLDQTILEIYKILGELNVYSGDSDQAIHFLEIYLRYVKDDPYIWAIYGQALFDDGEQLEQAMLAFDLALDLDENSLTALLFRGYAYLELGEGQLAVNDLFIARNFDRESFRASIGLARALALSERYDDAISQFTGSEQLSKNVLQQAEVYYWRAKTFDKIKDIKSAGQDFLALLDLSSEEIPEDWTEEAESYLFQLTPTPTMTNSPPPPTETPTLVTPTLTSTSTPMPTKITPSPTLTRTPTATLITPSPSPTPQPTKTAQPRE